MFTLPAVDLVLRLLDKGEFAAQATVGLALGRLLLRGEGRSFLGGLGTLALGVLVVVLVAAIAIFLAWDPDTLFLTHFGPFHGARLHFQQLMSNIAEWSRIVQRLLADGTMDDAQRQRAFVEEASQQLKRVVGEAAAEQYGRAGRLDYSWQGLARYWRKREFALAGGSQGVR